MTRAQSSRRAGKPGRAAGPRRPPRRFGERTIGEEVERELAFHLEMRAEELIADGWSPAEAHAEALRLFGDRHDIEAACRELEARRRRAKENRQMLDTLRQDLKYALRQLIAQRGFTVAALLTLALGIGATSAIFSLVDGVLLRPLPWPEPDRVVAVAEIDDEGRSQSVSTPNFADWRDHLESFEALSVYSGGTDSVVVDGEAWNAGMYAVSGRDFLAVFGIAPAMGRGFAAEELTPGGDAAALVSHRFYRRHLDPTRPLEDQRLEMLGKTFRVVGIAPPGFAFPEEADLWYPTELWDDPSSRTAHNWRVVGRLAPGVALESAQAELSHLAERLQQEHAGDNDAVDARITPLKEVLVGPSRRPLLMLLGAAVLVLLVSATNLAGALLARGLGRRGELGIRSALGAGRGRMVRQLLTETTVLTLAGGLVGLGLAHLLIRLVRAVEPGRLPRLAEVAIDGRVLLFTAVVSLLTGLVFGLAPALFATRTELRDVLSESGRSGAGGRRPAWSLLVGAEVALAVCLLVGAGLLLKGLWTLLQVDPGFRSDRILTLDLTVPDIDPPTDWDPVVYRVEEREVGAYLERFEEDFRAVPGVARVALTSSLPLAGYDVNGTVCLDAEGECFQSEDPARRSYGSYRVVSDDYFAVLGIPLIAGRVFDSRDRPGAQHVAVVSERFARETWPQQDPIGKLLRPVGLDLYSEVPATVVGVVADVRHRGLDAEPPATFYLSIQQRPWRARWATALFESEGDLGQIAGAVRSRLRREHPRLPVELVPMQEHRLDSVAEERFTSTVLTAFAVLALSLAAIGVWSVVSYQVAQRTRELGIRIALGAAPRGVLRLVVTDLLKTVAIGGALGLAVAFAASRILEAQLHGVSARDPATFATVSVVILAAAVGAALLPAARAARIDPIEAMTEA